MGVEAGDPIDQLITGWSTSEGSSVAPRRASSSGVAIVFEGREVTYRQLGDRVGSVAGELRSAGVGRGDRLVFCGLNRVELIEAMLACCRIGAVFCPMNNRLTPAEVAILLADCRPALSLVTDGFDELLLAAGGTVRNLETDPFPNGAAQREPLEGVTVDDPALMVYTSGTTGAPKGAVHTQASLLATWRNSVDYQGLTSDDCIIAPLPTFHVGGLNIQTLPTLLVGGTVVLQRRFDPNAVLDAIRTHRPTQTLLVPAMLDAIAAHPDFASTDLSCLDGIMSGSSIVPEAVMRPFFDRGIPVGQVYGTTETGPTAVVLGYGEAAARIGSCGRPAKFTDLRIVDPLGNDVEDGVDGELWVRGPNIFSHYWEKPEATAAAFSDGWFRTGDVGHRDSDGFVTIADRVTDVVISGGENVYPAEVEAVLAAHPAIAEVAVVGRPDERWGETPVAVVVATSGVDLAGEELEVEALRSWCSGQLARFKQPTAVVIVEELPRTALGKVRKHQLRADLAGGVPEAHRPD